MLNRLERWGRWIDRSLPGVNRFLTVGLILTLLSIGGLWIYLRASAPLPRGPANALKLSPTPRSATETPQLPQGKFLTETIKEVFTESDLASPEIQKFMNILESPAYETFMEKNPRGMGDYFDFFESQGVDVNKNKILTLFKNSTPKIEPAVLEQQMRSELSALLRENPIEIGTNAGLVVLQDVITEFLSKEQNVSWMMTHFQGDTQAFGEWTVDILRNPIPETAEPSSVVNSNASSPPIQRTAESDFSLPSRETPEREEPERLEVTERTGPEDDPHIDLENLEAGIPEVPEPRTEERMETVLRQQFSPDRFNRAMQTLNQYGPEEGLRRLKASDPEVAKQVEQLLPKQ